MKIHRIDLVGVIVHDLPAAKAFFLDLGLEVLGEGELQGELVDRAAEVSLSSCPATGRLARPLRTIRW